MMYVRKATILALVAAGSSAFAQENKGRVRGASLGERKLKNGKNTKGSKSSKSTTKATRGSYEGCENTMTVDYCGIGCSARTAYKFLVTRASVATLRTNTDENEAVLCLEYAAFGTDVDTALEDRSHYAILVDEENKQASFFTDCQQNCSACSVTGELISDGIFQGDLLGPSDDVGLANDELVIMGSIEENSSLHIKLSLFASLLDDGRPLGLLNDAEGILEDFGGTGCVIDPSV